MWRLICCLFCSGALLGQADSTVLLVSADAYYRLASDAAPSPTFLALDHDAVTPGWLSVGVSHTTGRAGFTGQVAVGQRSEQFFPAPDFTALRTAFAHYDLTDQLRLSAGYFPLYYGAELDDPYANDHYSNSYAYTNAPGGLAGAQAQYSLGEQTTALLGLYNGAFTRRDPDGRKVVGGQLNHAAGPLFLSASFLGGHAAGDFDFLVLDLLATYEIGQRWRLGGELAYQPYRLRGAAGTYYLSAVGYLRYRPAPPWTLALRSELLHEDSGFNFGRAATVAALTATASFTNGPLRVFAEGRADAGLPGRSGTVTGGLLGVAVLLEHGL